MFHQPASIEEALTLKARLGDRARFLAGGTDVVVMWKKGRLNLEDIVDLSRIEAPQTPGLQADGSFYVGALTPHRALEEGSVIVLADAARTVGGPQIRNRGTIGGNVGTASPAGDVSVALLALDASIELISLKGTRSMKLHEFFLGVGKTAIAPDEMILGFRFEQPAQSAFYKNGKRNSVAISVVCAGVSLSQEGTPFIALGSVAPTPLRLFETEAFLKREGLSPGTIEEAAKRAAIEVRPITDHRASAEYRRAMAGVLVGRLLNDLCRGISS